jgi:transposase
MAVPRVASDKKGALKREAKLGFLDESGFSLKPSVRRTWAPRGQTPTLTYRFNWKRLNAIGTLICEPDGSEPDLLLHLQPKGVKDDAIVAYLEDQHRQVRGAIVLLWDHLRAHCGKKVADYLAHNRDWLHVEWFPSYAPELNPMEYFWSATKGKPLANLTPDRLDQLQCAIERAHRRTRRQPHLLHDFLVASKLYGPELLVNTEGKDQ